MNRYSLFIIIVGILVVGSVTQIMVAHQLSTAGIELATIEKEYNKLSLENETMNHAIASASSLSSISGRAKMLGFFEAQYTHIERPQVAYEGVQAAQFAQ